MQLHDQTTVSREVREREFEASCEFRIVCPILSRDLEHSRRLGRGCQLIQRLLAPAVATTEHIDGGRYCNPLYVRRPEALEIFIGWLRSPQSHADLLHELVDFGSGETARARDASDHCVELIHKTRQY